MDLQNLGREVAISHLDSMGLDCDVSENGVRFKLGECRFRVENIHKASEGASAALSFSLVIGNTSIDEFLIGYGLNGEEAVAQGVCDWMCGMVAPVIALHEPVGLKNWGCRKVSIMASTGDRYRNWDVVLGQVVSNDQEGVVYALLEQNPPFGMALDAVTARLHEESLHWAKVFAMRADGEGTSGEVRVDNEVDLASERQLKAFRWPRTKQPVIWFRQFAALAPGEEVSKEEFEALIAQTQR